MGIFDKINEAIGQIQDLAAQVGVSSSDNASNRSSAESATAPSGEKAGGSSVGASGAAALAGRVGGPPGLDPLCVLDESAVADVVGIAVTSAYDNLDEDWIGRVYSLDGGGHAEVRFAAAPEGAVFDADGWWAMATENAVDAVPVDLGDDGLVSGGVVFVRTHGMIVHTLVASSGGDYDTATAQRLAARTVAALD